MAIHVETGNRIGEADELGNLGNIYLDQGDLTKAEDHLQQTLAIYRGTSNLLGVANALGGLGNVYKNQDDLTKAEDQHQQALAIDRQIGHRLGEAQDLGGLGLVAEKQADIKKSCRLLKEALQIFETIGASAEVDQTRKHLARLGCDEDGEGRSGGPPLLYCTPPVAVPHVQRRHPP